MPNWLTATVVKRHQWNNRLCSLTLQLDIPEFEAGQFIRLGLEIDGKVVTRPYSLVNSPAKILHEICFNRVTDGLLSTRLFNLQPGSILLSAPKAAGFFTLTQVPTAQQLWLCATGTGLGPYLSMLDTLAPWERFEHIILIHGVRDQSEMIYLDQLQAIKFSHPLQFNYFYSVTRAVSTAHFTQRIPELLLSNEIENGLGIKLTPATAQVMLCGNSGMIDTCVSLLSDRGLSKNQRHSPGQITLEAY